MDPVVIRDGRYRLPTLPGYSAEMRPDSLATSTSGCTPIASGRTRMTWPNRAMAADQIIQRWWTLTDAMQDPYSRT